MHSESKQQDAPGEFGHWMQPDLLYRFGRESPCFWLSAVAQGSIKSCIFRGLDSYDSSMMILVHLGYLFWSRTKSYGHYQHPWLEAYKFLAPLRLLSPIYAHHIRLMFFPFSIPSLQMEVKQLQTLQAHSLANSQFHACDGIMHRERLFQACCKNI